MSEKRKNSEVTQVPPFLSFLYQNNPERTYNTSTQLYQLQQEVQRLLGNPMYRTRQEESSSSESSDSSFEILDTAGRPRITLHILDSSSSDDTEADISVEVLDSDFEEPHVVIPDSSCSSEESSSGSTDNETYDPDFEDPRLFRHLNEKNELPDCAVLSEHHKVEQAEGKHLWPCVVCVEQPPDTLFSPCNHAICCQSCSVNIEGKCPICDTLINKIERLFFTQQTCVVCWDKPPKTVFKPCCHAVCCESCARALDRMRAEDQNMESKCPVCNAVFTKYENFILAYV